MDDVPGTLSCRASLPPGYTPPLTVGVYASHSVCVVLEIDADAPVPSMTAVTVDGKLYFADAWYSVDGVVADSADLNEVIPERAAASEHSGAAACIVATPLAEVRQASSMPIVVDIPETDITTVFASLISSATCNALVKSEKRRCRNRALKSDDERCWCHRDRSRFPAA